MRGCCRVDLVDCFRCDVDSRLKAKGHVCAPEVIVDGLWQRDDIESLFRQAICCLCRAVAAEHHKAVELQFVVVLLHRLDLVESVLIRLINGLIGYPARAKDGTAPCQDAGEVPLGQHPELAVDQALVAILKAIDLDRLLALVVEALHHAAHCRIQCLTVTATCQHTNSKHLYPPLKDPLSLIGDMSDFSTAAASGTNNIIRLEGRREKENTSAILRKDSAENRRLLLH